MLRPGELVGGWVVDAPLAEGGMGTVHRVHSALTERLVAALKIMKPSADPNVRARFVREAESLAALRHPSVVRVMEFTEDPVHGLVYLVMELAEGQTLRDRIAHGPLGIDEMLALFVPLARGLDHAHDCGVFHRDLKPSNIVLCDDGSVRLVDFGIAAAQDAEPLTNTGQLGTLAYLPPEVFKGEKTAPAATDVYAFGLLMHEALTGLRAFPVEPHLTPAAAAAAVGLRKLHPPDMELPEYFPAQLRALIRRATSSDPDVRPRMKEVRTALEAISASDLPEVLLPAAAAAPPLVEATMRVPDPTPFFTRLRQPNRRQALVASALLALVLASGGAWMAHTSRASTTERRTSVRTAASTLPVSTDLGTRPTSRPTSRPVRATPSPASAMPGTPAFGLQAPLLGIASPTFPPSEPPARIAVKRNASAPAPAEDAETHSAGAALSGRWELTHELETGARSGYRLDLQQHGDQVSGRGVKLSENGQALPPEKLAIVEATGRIHGQHLEMTLVERTAAGSRTSTVRWRIPPGADAVEGGVQSEGEGRGSSAARRLPETSE